MGQGGEVRAPEKLYDIVAVGVRCGGAQGVGASASGQNVKIDAVGVRAYIGSDVRGSVLKKLLSPWGVLPGSVIGSFVFLLPCVQVFIEIIKFVAVRILGNIDTDPKKFSFEFNSCFKPMESDNPVFPWLVEFRFCLVLGRFYNFPKMGNHLPFFQIETSFLYLAKACGGKPNFPQILPMRGRLLQFPVHFAGGFLIVLDPRAFRHAQFVAAHNNGGGLEQNPPRPIIDA